MRCFRCKTVFEISTSQPPASPYSESESEEPTTQISKSDEGEHEGDFDPGGSAAKEIVSIRSFITRSLVVSVLLAAAFFGFVAWQNGWNLSLRKLPKQIEIAVLGKDSKNSPDDVEGLKIDLGEIYKLKAIDDRTVLVVNGKVTNATRRKKIELLLKGTVVGPGGVALFEVKAPCGMVRSDVVLKMSKKGTLENYYKNKGEYRSCELNIGSVKTYQIVFDDVPPNVKEPFTVKVTAASFSNHD